MPGQHRYPELRLFIDGEWLDNRGRKTETVIDPGTGEALAELPHATPEDLDRAAAAAGRAFKEWRATSAYERSKVLRRAASLMRDRVDAIAHNMVMEQGKTLTEARFEVMNSADVIDWDAEEGRRTYGRIVPSRDGSMRWTVSKEPVGPVAAFTPWNFPAMLPSRKISAALATGCSIVIKPSEETPSTVLEIARAFADAGLPKGVLNVVYGVPADVSSHLIAASEIRKITFTGSTSVGIQIASLAAKHGAKRATMELGGHAPVLIFADADVELAIQQMSFFKYRNAGQVCVSPTRFYVHESVHDRFVDGFSSAIGKLKVGYGLEESSTMGALANSRRIGAMERLVQDAVDNGATVSTGGQRLGNQGNFFAPTLLTDVPASARIMNEEPFGPVASTVRFSDFDEAISHANRLPFGLAAYAYTSSAKTAAALGNQVESGMLGINNFMVTAPETPFGGVKQSGYGSEGGTEGLDSYLTTKMISQS